MKIKGEGSYVDASGARHEIFGVGDLPDDMALRSLKVSGKLSFETISCDKVKVSGKCEGGFLTAKNFSVEGKVELDDLKVEQTFELEGKPKIDSIEADEIVIESQSGFIETIKCKKLEIFNHTNATDATDFANIFTRKFFGEDIIHVDSKRTRVRIKSIEAETVALENCEVDVIRCTNAVIGTNCKIDKLFVTGEYKISADSKVGEVN